MLVLDIGSREGYDEQQEEFVTISGTRVELEHSLFSISKWESKFEKPFLNSEIKSREETVAYIKAMALDPDLPPEVFQHLSEAEFQQVDAYINANMTATTFKEIPGAPSSSSGEYITAEIIYYWMVSLNIPFECQHWHLNRLITLVKVINKKNEPKKKMSFKDQAAQRRMVNQQRKQQMGTTG